MLTEEQIIKLYFEGMREGLRYQSHSPTEYGPKYIGAHGKKLDDAIEVIDGYEEIWLANGLESLVKNLVPHIKS